MSDHTKVFISPSFDSPDDGRGGIRFVIEALRKHLPKFGVEVVDHPSKADVLNVHVAAEVAGYDHLPMVHSCHGLYWTNFTWTGLETWVNEGIVEVMKKADVVTVPSHWVKQAVGRGISQDIRVIHHGVDTDNWSSPPIHDGHVLWNKNRLDPVCDPMALVNLSQMMPKVEFITTLYPRDQRRGRNIEIIGVLPQVQHKPYLQRANVYLATTLETFGTSTLEALASGVPVAGWDFGGTAEIVKHGQTGYLAPPGDVNALVECVRKCIGERDRLSANAIRDVQERWQWIFMVEKYARIFKELHHKYDGWNTNKDPLVSVVVPCHNYGHLVGDTIESVVNQTFGNWELIVVDDASIDSTKAVVEKWMERDLRIRKVRATKRLDMSGARNFGAEHAKGKYISFLDADDRIAPTAIEVLVRSMMEDKGLHIAYGHLDVFNDEGQQWRSQNWPGKGFVWEHQMAHMNQIPTFNMMRRDTFMNSCGYRRRMEWGEDAHLWAYMTSFGATARKITEKSIFYYRVHPNSKSMRLRKEGKSERFTEWLPWHTAVSFEQARSMTSFDIKEPKLVPFSAPYDGSKIFSHHHNPALSIVIPVGKGHEHLVIDAIDSVLAQDYIDWEIIVVNDTGNPIHVPSYARLLETEGNVGAGAARNLGAKQARGRSLMFLDADDTLLPGKTLSTMWKAHEESGNIIYGNLIALNQGELEHYEVREPYYGDDLTKSCLQEPTRPVTCIVTKKAHMAVGGFDETFETWEDWDWEIALSVHGECATKLPISTFVYRKDEGYRRRLASVNEAGTAKAKEVATEKNKEYKLRLFNKWKAYYTGEKIMGCTGCGKERLRQQREREEMRNRLRNERRQKLTGNRSKDARQLRQLSPLGQSTEKTETNQPIRLEYLGTNIAPRYFIGEVTKQRYRFGQSSGHQVVPVDPRDAVIFLSRTQRGEKLFRLYRDSKPAPPAPKQIEIMPSEVFKPPTPAPPKERVQPVQMPEGILEMPRNARDIRAQVSLQNKATLANWLNQERQRPQERKTVVAAIMAQLNEFEEGDSNGN